jgi:hypothetical protein
MRTLEELPFSEVLEGRIQEDKQLNRPFEAATEYAQSGIPGRLTAHMRDFGRTHGQGGCGF